jgi:hypothetical protein
MADGKEFTDRLLGLRKRSPYRQAQIRPAVPRPWHRTPPCPAAASPDQRHGERLNGRIEKMLQSHQFRSGEELETRLNRYGRLCNQQLAQSALGSKTPLQAMKNWHKLKPDLFKKQPCHLPGCDR